VVAHLKAQGEPTYNEAIMEDDEGGGDFDAMGFGDVKLAGVLGAGLAWLGWGPLVVGGFAAFLLGGAYGVALILSGRGGLRTGVPFGPWMVLGAALGVAVGEPVWSAYLRLVGLA